jgi:Domain of unknown function (DUF1996)
MPVLLRRPQPTRWRLGWAAVKRVPWPTSAVDRSRRVGVIAAIVVGSLVVASLVTPPSKAEAAGAVGQFVVRCRYTHTLQDDPIVFPGQPGLSHSHDFFGNVSTDAFSTVSELLSSRTTCRPSSDTAPYWAPTGYMNGKRIEPKAMRIYYLGNAGQHTETIPAGLKVIGGNRDAASPSENPHVSWYCGETREVRTPRRDAPYDCSPWSQYAFVDGTIAIVNLPNCWDGVGLELESVAYEVGGICPAGFPHVLPRLSQRIHYGIMNPTNADGSVGLTLSSGPYWSMHSDFWNTWQQERLDELVQTCLVEVVHCGGIDSSASLAWARQFGTSRYDLGYAATAGRGGPYVAGFTNYQLTQAYRRRSDVFVRAYDGDGKVRWTRQFGSGGIDQALAASAVGNQVYVSGFTDGRLPGQTANGRDDAFVASFDSSGDLEWLTQFGTRADEQATAIAATQASGVYVAGWTDGVVRPGAGARGRDAWIAKLSPGGTRVWIRQFGSAGTDEIRALGVRGIHPVTAGWTDASLQGGSSVGDSDAFVRAYWADGRVAWTQQFGTIGNDIATAVAGFKRRVFVGGSTSGTFADQEASGGLDAFVQAMGSDGSTAWADQFGTAADDDAAAIVAGRSGVYVTGSTLGALTTDPGLLGETDVFASRYLRKGGAPIWTMQLGTIDFDRAYGAAIDAASMYVTGTTHGTFEGQNYAGDRDAFLLRLRFT